MRNRPVSNTRTKTIRYPRLCANRVTIKRRRFVGFLFFQRPRLCTFIIAHQLSYPKVYARIDVRKRQRWQWLSVVTTWKWVSTRMVKRDQARVPEYYYYYVTTRCQTITHFDFEHHHTLYIFSQTRPLSPK